MRKVWLLREGAGTRSVFLLALTFLLFASLLALMTTSCSSQKNSESEEAGESPKSTVQPQTGPSITYTVLDKDVYDAPVKTQVTWNILVEGEISKPVLFTGIVRKE